jgi:DNA-binding MarR family transcriptional regulator
MMQSCDFDDGSIESYDDVKYLDILPVVNEETEFPPATTVPRALGRLRVALEDAYLRVSRQLGLTAQQAELLCAALRPAAVGELATVLRCDQSNVTRLVDRASKRGLIHRRADQRDGRVTVIELSPKGRRLAEKFIESLEGQLAGLLAEWPERQQQTAVDAMNEISEALDSARPTKQRRAKRTT